jgi:hypothetical protein
LIKYKTSMASDTVVSEKLEDPLQGQSVVEGGSVCKTADPKTQAAAGTEAGLIRKSFGWITLPGVLQLPEHITAGVF